MAAAPPGNGPGSMSWAARRGRSARAARLATSGGRRRWRRRCRRSGRRASAAARAASRGSPYRLRDHHGGADERRVAAEHHDAEADAVEAAVVGGRRLEHQRRAPRSRRTARRTGPRRAATGCGVQAAWSRSRSAGSSSRVAMRGRRVATVPSRTRWTACRWAARAPSTSPSASSPTCSMRCGRAPSSSPARSKMRGVRLRRARLGGGHDRVDQRRQAEPREHVVQRHVPVRDDADREARGAQALHHVGRVREGGVRDRVGEARQQRAGVEPDLERLGEHAGALQADGRERLPRAGAVADRAVVPDLGLHRHVAAVERDLDVVVVAQRALQARHRVGQRQDRAHRVERDRVEVAATGCHVAGCSAVTRAASRAGSSGDGVNMAGSTIWNRFWRDGADALQLVQLAQRRQRARRAGRHQPDVRLVAGGGGEGGEPDGGGVEALHEAGEGARGGALDEHLGRRLAGGARERLLDALVDRPRQLHALGGLAGGQREPRDQVAGDRRVGQRPAQHRHARGRLDARREHGHARQRRRRQARRDVVDRDQLDGRAERPQRRGGAGVGGDRRPVAGTHARRCRRRRRARSRRRRARWRSARCGRRNPRRGVRSPPGERCTGGRPFGAHDSPGQGRARRPRKRGFDGTKAA